jgi:anti-sigma regulatory factor (Ser/Thr protein kinase)
MLPDAGEPAPGVQGLIRLDFPADPMAVRHALGQMFAALPPDLLDEDSRGSAEIVMTEVLNNIVEHAYAGRAGRIGLALIAEPAGLVCTVTDRGRPMPAGLRYVRTGHENRLTFCLPATMPRVCGHTVDVCATLP